MINTEGQDRSEYEDTPTGCAQRWERELTAAIKEKEKFTEDARRINKAYLDKRDEVMEGSTRRVNLFWANIQVLRATLFSRKPKADVSRTGKDFNDDAARVAGDMQERILNLDIEKDTGSYYGNVRQCVEDWLIVGLGQAWNRYEVETRPIEGMGGQPMVGPDGQPLQEIAKEDVYTDYVNWDDFLWSPCRVWEERRWVARRVYMTKEKVTKRFGAKIAAAIPYKTKDSTKNDPTLPQNKVWAQAEIYEIWSIEDRKAYWHCKGYDVILDIKDDPLQLDNFFPCPKPLFATLTSSNSMPRADYIMVQDQYESINVAQTRIHWLMKACRVAGGYDGNNEGLKNIFQEGRELNLVPVDNWAMFAEKGGIVGGISFVPIKEIGDVIAKLREETESAKQQIYEVLGLSDIMRGATRATETATAQQLKAQFGSTRLQDYQQTVADFVTETQQIKAEIIAKHFQPETIIHCSNIMNSIDAPHAQAGVALIKSPDGYNGYRVKVEAESMAAIDWASERDARTEALTAITTYLTGVAPLAQQMPEMSSVLVQLLQWALAGFRVGRQIETVLDQAAQQLARSGAPKQPSPMEKAELKKTESESAKNFATADKTMAETKAVQIGAATQVASNVIPMPGGAQQ